jgi:hypothetical protein
MWWAAQNNITWAPGVKPLWGELFLLLSDPTDRFEYATGDTRRYLLDDLALDCDSDKYTATLTVAISTLIVWPVGVPLLYAVLLWMSRDALTNGRPTPLSRATAFLSDDYKLKAFWWEPVEMCKKLTLTGKNRLLLVPANNLPRSPQLAVATTRQDICLLFDDSAVC